MSPATLSEQQARWSAGIDALVVGCALCVPMTGIAAAIRRWVGIPALWVLPVFVAGSMWLLIGRQIHAMTSHIDRYSAYFSLLTVTLSLGAAPAAAIGWAASQRPRWNSGRTLGFSLLASAAAVAACFTMLAVVVIGGMWLGISF
ncbi:MAG: hypothetical protein ABJD11_10855 [Gemmatimonadota bacterium]